MVKEKKHELSPVSPGLQVRHLFALFLMSARTEGVTQFQAVGYRTQTQTQNRLWHTCKIIIWACLNSRVLMLNPMFHHVPH